MNAVLGTHVDTSEATHPALLDFRRRALRHHVEQSLEPQELVVKAADLVGRVAEHARAMPGVDA